MLIHINMSANAHLDAMAHLVGRVFGLTQLEPLITHVTVIDSTI